MWYGVAPRMGDMDLKKIKLRAQSMIIMLYSIVNIIGKTYKTI